MILRSQHPAYEPRTSYQTTLHIHDLRYMCFINILKTSATKGRGKEHIRSNFSDHPADASNIIEKEKYVLLFLRRCLNGRHRIRGDNSLMKKCSVEHGAFRSVVTVW